MIKVNIENNYNDEKGGVDILSDININGSNNNLKVELCLAIFLLSQLKITEDEVNLLTKTAYHYRKNGYKYEDLLKMLLNIIYGKREEN